MGTVRDKITLGSIELNGSDWRWVCDEMSGWEGSAALDVVIVPRGAGHGAFAGADWLSRERYITIGGAVVTESRAAAQLAQDQLLGVLSGTITLTRNGRRVWVQLYDQAELDLITARGFRFVIPLVALDPFKYEPSAQVAQAGAWAGSVYYYVYASNARTYTTNARTYLTSQLSESGYPEAAVIVNAGNVDSQRMTITVNGPLIAGDWHVENATTGEELWADVTLAAGQSLTLDCRELTAELDGQHVESAVYGDWLKLVPGDNVLRLSTGTASLETAYMTVRAHSAWR